MKKKIISILLALACIIPCFTMIGVSAEEGAGYVVSGEGRLPFEDINEKHWAYDAANFCYINELIKGQGNTYTFAPNAKLSRATFVVMLARVMNADLSAYENTSRFNDCPVGSWYTASIEWAADQGYVNGISSYKFGPNLIMDREQLASVVVRLLESLGYEIDVSGNPMNNYTDKNQVADWAQRYVEAIVASKIMSSTDANKLVFSPKMTMTRAQAASIFMRIMTQYLYSECTHSYTEADCTNASSCVKCGLVFSLPNGHYCKTLSCKEGGVCITCGQEVAADAALHKFTVKASCTTPEKCDVCGYVRTKATAHKFSAATCTAPKTCKVCSAKEGSALGHTTKFGICTRCNGEVFASKYLRAAYYMSKKAKANGDGTYEDSRISYDSYNNVAINSLIYDANVTGFSIAYAYSWTNTGDIVVFAIDIPKVSSNYTYGCVYYNADGSPYCYAEGTVNASTKKQTISEYVGKANEKAKFNEIISACLSESLSHTDSILWALCDESISIFGF